MFGRREEDYEKYNQRQNAKYDDDYIRDTDEYREECTHSHEQTYRNYDRREEHEEYREECTHSHEQTYRNYDRREEHKEYREECDHDHGQTYEDFNSEQRPYDERYELEKFFASNLEDGEYILWCGEPQKNADASETGLGCIGSTGCILYAIAFAFLLLSPFIAIFLIIVASFMRNTSNIKGQKYAITNRRVIICGGSKPCMLSLDYVCGVSFHSSQRNIGYVTFNVRPEYNRRNPRKPPLSSNAFYAVKEPEKVAGILKQAIENYRN